HRVSNRTAEVVDAPVDHLLLVLARRGHLRLAAHLRPDTGQRWQFVDLYFILVDQREVRLWPKGLFFQLLQLLTGLLESDLVAFALERVLGTLEGEAFFLEQTTHLVLAEADSRLLGEVLGQAGGAPGGETVAQSQRAGSHRLTQAGTEVVGGATGPARAVA